MCSHSSVASVAACSVRSLMGAFQLAEHLQWVQHWGGLSGSVKAQPSACASNPGLDSYCYSPLALSRCEFTITAAADAIIVAVITGWSRPAGGLGWVSRELSGRLGGLHWTLAGAFCRLSELGRDSWEGYFAEIVLGTLGRLDDERAKSVVSNARDYLMQENLLGSAVRKAVFDFMNMRTTIATIYP